MWYDKINICDVDISKNRQVWKKIGSILYESQITKSNRVM